MASRCRYCFLLTAPCQECLELQAQVRKGEAKLKALLQPKDEEDEISTEELLLAIVQNSPPEEEWEDEMWEEEEDEIPTEQILRSLRR